MSFITIDKGPGTYSRNKTDENGNRIGEIENIDYNENTYHVSFEENTWLIDEKLFLIAEADNGMQSVMQGKNVIVTGKIIKTNF